MAESSSLLSSSQRSYSSVPPTEGLSSKRFRPRRSYFVAGAVCLLCVAITVFSVSRIDEDRNLSPVSLAETAGPDRFEFYHTFGGYGTGGRFRHLDIAPPRVLQEDGSSSDGSGSASSGSAAASSGATSGGSASSGSASSGSASSGSASSDGSSSSSSSSSSSDGSSTTGSALPINLLNGLSDYGVVCAGACTIPRAFNLLDGLVNVGVNLQTGQRISDRKNGPVASAAAFNPISSPFLVVFIVETTMVGDVKIVDRNPQGQPTRAILSGEVLDNADVQRAKLDGVVGVVFSLRLPLALIALATDFGARADTSDWLSMQWFNCKFGNAMNPNYTDITYSTTQEGPGRFTDFMPLEKLEIIRWWYMMPPVLHRLPGLNWALRRQYALEHPFYTYVPAVSWPDNQDISYTEFLDITFSRDCDTMRHLFLHEKTHFYFGRVMSDALKQQWEGLGGWTMDWNQIWAALGTSTQFVSGYAASVDPNEDLAESVAEFILHPSLVRTRSLPKYNFLRDYVMNGVEYIPKFWPQASFQVLNPLANEDRYPNPVESVHISVVGGEFEDKNVTVVINLKAETGWTSPITAFTDITPPSGSSDASLTLNFVQTGNVLTAEVTVPKTEEYGFWRSAQLHLHDALGITRWIHLDESNWRVYINNKYYGENPLVYQPGSVSTVVDAAINIDDALNAHKYGDADARPRLNINFNYVGEHRPYYRWPASARVVRKNAKQSYYVEGWGTCPEDLYQGDNIHRCTVSYLLSDYVAGDWYVAQLFMQESTGHSYREFFSTYEWDELPTIFTVPGKGSDETAPEINTLSLTIEAAPVNPTAPNGETVIKFSFQAKDEEAGLAKWTYRLLDPSGVSHLKTIDLTGNATLSLSQSHDWHVLEAVITVPHGSPPGEWGIEEIEVWDRAGNRADLRMVDTQLFMPMYSLPDNLRAPNVDIDVGILMNPPPSV